VAQFRKCATIPKRAGCQRRVRTGTSDRLPDELDYLRAAYTTNPSQPGELLHYIFLKWRGPGDWTVVWNGAGRMLRAESKKQDSP